MITTLQILDALKVSSRGVLLIWIIVGQGPIVLAAGAGGGCLDIFLSSIFPLFFPPLWEMARYKLKFCLKEPLSLKQPTKQPTGSFDQFYSALVIFEAFVLVSVGPRFEPL